ncbi:MAG: hypothetical protein HXY46_13265 [Syntrophaceae bacterium]|nr:hypothetical protein [Syntrophaceae bacterium]
MPPRKKGLRENLRSGIRELLLQELRLLRLERAGMPRFIIEAESYAIQEAKRDIVRLTEAMSEREREALLKKMIRQVLDEEIDQAVQLRRNRCLRCIHMRYYDREGIARIDLPFEASQAQAIGCDVLRNAMEERCERFVEATRAVSLEDYLGGMTLLYELREMFERLDEIWEDYFIE